MTMLEKAARAAEIVEREWNPNEGKFYECLARAVLMAVREMPGETQQAIFDARDGFVHEIDIPAVWEMGVDAILNEGAKTNG